VPRPKKKRCIDCKPCVSALKPERTDGKSAEDFICIELDELEALRLADYLGYYQEQAAAKMGVSRVTFGRILKSARGKIARAIFEGREIRLEKVKE
jgi:predicted DNA-binding protein (UPF0251 family)